MIGRRRLGDDSGASLIFALVIITVFSLIVAVILSFADSSLRVTMALRQQVAVVNSADGAAQIAINALRKGTFDATGAHCFGTLDTLPLDKFYRPPSGPADSAVVDCALDAAHSGVAPVNPAKPRNAVLTLGNNTESGMRVTVAGARDLKVHGGVFANSSINVVSGSLTSDASVTASNCSGTINATPPKVCNNGSSAAPFAYPPPPAPPNPTPKSIPPCTLNVPLQLLTFDPGVYTDVTSLNLLSRCPNAIFHFNPGRYYFAFDGDGEWDIIGSYLIGGTETVALKSGVAPTNIPGACKSPVPPTPAVPGWTPPAAGEGVQFVFGGASHISFTNSQAEICGNYSPTDPPIALYGLTTAVGAITPQSGCIVNTPYPTNGCAVIQSDVNTRFHVQGTAYLPRSVLDLAFNNPSGLLFSYAVIARSLQLAPAVGANLTRPVIALPDNAASRTLVHLTVYLCPGKDTCTKTTGVPRIRAVVGIGDPTGTPVAGARWVTVYSWSTLR